MDIPLLPDIVAIFCLSIGVLLVCHQVKIPPIVGFLLTGVLCGPTALGLVQNPHAVELLAEIGVVLLLFSLLFYAWGEPVYIVLMLFSSVVDYSHGLLMEKFDGRPGVRRALLISSVAINLSLLGFFKYAGLVVSTLNAALSLSIPVPSVALPVGISFYTFQTMSYSIDVYRRNCPAQRDPIAFGCYVTMFPQLIAGPIVRYVDVMREINDRRETFEGFYLGIRRFLVGLAKKLILANGVGMLWDSVSAQPAASLSALSAWLGVLAYAFQIYFDFSGYSDMAIGLGRIFGFRFNENFDYPYLAASVTEFWRRWHMSLTTWFREYLYIPLGGNRGGTVKTLRNIFIVWFCTGFWHGASWNFILWGLYFAVWLVLEKYVFRSVLARTPGWIKHTYTILVVFVGWGIFAMEDLSVCGGYLRACFGGAPLWRAADLYALHSYAVTFLALIICSTTLGHRGWQRLPRRAAAVATPVLMLASLLLCTAYLVDGSYNPFLYFRF